MATPPPAISPFDWDKGITPEQRWKLLHEGQGFPYILRPAAKTLVIGAGGGYDVARALAGGSRDITAVEINPIIATTIMRDRFAAESHRIYFRPEVHVTSRTAALSCAAAAEKYQVIQATLVDTWASTAAGAFALSENNLYTSDAFYDYLIHLTADGLLSFTRWGFDPPRESLRLVSLAMDAFARLGEADPASHVIAVRANAAAIKGWGALDTVLHFAQSVHRRGYRGASAGASAEAEMEVVYAPGDRPANPFGQLLDASDPQAFFRDYPYNVAPVERRPAVLLLHRAAARSVELRAPRQHAQRGLQGQSSRAPAVRRDGHQPGRYRADAAAAALAAGRAASETKAA